MKTKAARRDARDATAPVPAGMLMISLAGTMPDADERRRLANPLVGGVVLFAHNFESPAQLKALTAEIRAVAATPPIIAADQEGGRVQRFRDGFTRLPPAALYGRLYDESPKHGRRAAMIGGFVMATGLRRTGLTCCFTPVLDLAAAGADTVIGHRAFHADPNAVAVLARAWAAGMGAAGLAAVAKHYPGHGHVRADSHHESPCDERPLAQIRAQDLAPYRALIESGLQGVMSAHVRYPNAEAEADTVGADAAEAIATYSKFWLQRVLRDELGFNGAVFSDDLVMAGAAAGGTPPQRVHRALAAGCDMALACNDTDFIEAVLTETVPASVPGDATTRAKRLMPFHTPRRASLLRYEGRTWDAQQATEALIELCENAAAPPVP